MANGNLNPLAVPIPIFTGEKYDTWRIKVKTYFMSQNLWDIVNDGISFDADISQSEQQQKQQQNNAAALFILQQAVDDYIFSKISGAQTAKEAWDILREEFQGCPQLIASSSLQLIASSSSQPTILSDEDTKNIEEECQKYLPLYKAILEGKLETVRELCDKDKDALKARITVNWDTALHVAVGTGKANEIFNYLLDKMSSDDQLLAQKNKEGNTILSVAAIVGNRRAADMILKKDEYKTLILDPNNSESIPLIEAARHGKKKMIKYLLPFSNIHLDYADLTRFGDDSGFSFLNLLINAGFYGLALKLLQKHGNLATKQLPTGESLLSTIAGKPSAFRSGQQAKRKFLQFFKFYKPGKSSAIPEEPKKPKFYQLFQLVSYIKEKREAEGTHHQALKLVKLLCEEITKNYYRPSSILKGPFLLAAKLGVCEVVKEIIESYPDAIWFTNENNQNIFHLAVINRQEKVLQLISGMSGYRHILLKSQDVDGNNVLHLAGKPKSQSNQIPNAAMQMQHELKWFKEVEKMVPADSRMDLNSDKKTPRMVFIEEHKELIKEGEKWIKDAASSCSFAAAIFVTIVFAAAITIPGDYNDDGHPNLYEQTAFTVFSVSNSFCFFTSTGAIIMFISILTSRYGEEDFLFSLPKQLTWCYVMLFYSIASLMVAFCATLYLVFRERNSNWILSLVVGLPIVPLSLFVSAKYSLLCDLIISTFFLSVPRKLRKWYEKVRKLFLR